MTMMRQIAASLLAIFFAGVAHGDDLAQPEGPVILTVTGAIEHGNGDGMARFDLAMLDALPQRETVTENPWYEGVQTFTGPQISALMHAVGAEGSALRLIAVNDYAATMPWEDVTDLPTILASRNNGEVMSVRDKGPLFVIYPFDEMEELRNEIYFGRSVWQVVAIEVLP